MQYSLITPESPCCCFKNEMIGNRELGRPSVECLSRFNYSFKTHVHLAQ